MTLVEFVVMIQPFVFRSSISFVDCYLAIHFSSRVSCRNTEPVFQLSTRTEVCGFCSSIPSPGRTNTGGSLRCLIKLCKILPWSGQWALVQPTRMKLLNVEMVFVCGKSEIGRRVGLHLTLVRWWVKQNIIRHPALLVFRQTLVPNAYNLFK